MKVGIAGVGFMGTTHAAGWAATDVEIVGFCAETPEEAQSIAPQYQARIYPDLKSLLHDVDVIDICTPTHLHHDMVLQAAQAGKHIICEKPLARTVEQAQEMIKACRAASVRLLVAHVVRFFPEYALAKSVVQAGQIGKPAIIRLARSKLSAQEASRQLVSRFRQIWRHVARSDDSRFRLRALDRGRGR